MRIATWNVNSIRARLDRVLAFLDRHDVDVLAIQETKCRDDQFPHLPFEAAGYEVAHVGLSQWNGVAVVSRVGLSDVQVGFEGMPGWGDPAQAEARVLSALCRDVRIVSIYVPNGRAVDDPHMAYKLDWLARLSDAVRTRLTTNPAEELVLMGDWNVAPLDEDVWSPEFFIGRTHVSPPERAAFQAVLDAGLRDLTREHTPGPGVFTYWDYTQLRFPKRQGMRIDFALGSPAVATRVTGAFIDREERKGKGASDHAPVVLDLA